MAEPAQKPVKLPRTAKGKKPIYFDSVTDKLLSMVLTLMGELSVVRDRLDTVERLIEKHKLFKQDEIETYELTDEVNQIRGDRRAPPGLALGPDRRSSHGPGQQLLRRRRRCLGGMPAFAERSLLRPEAVPRGADLS